MTQRWNFWGTGLAVDAPSKPPPIEFAVHAVSRWHFTATETGVGRFLLLPPSSIDGRTSRIITCLHESVNQKAIDQVAYPAEVVRRAIPDALHRPECDPHLEHGYDISTVPERWGHKDQMKRER
jgi:hypothetical protein